MSKLKIYTFPDPILAQKASPIVRVDRSFFKVADDMLETMYDAPGIGLAANQVGRLDRILVIDVEYDEDEFSGGLIKQKPIILINPEIIYKEGKTALKEGCLSVPDFRAEVDRSDKVKIQYKDLDNLTQTLDADGLLAVCIQHEIDHLDGKLFIDRLSPLKSSMVKKNLLKKK